ncbi:hypothetical protein I4U23_011635 [Adineta vaga]|nr:hypothetical protein I4U23_011635 [Adineta vaga]
MFTIGIIKNLRLLRVGTVQRYRVRKTDRELMKLVVCQIVMLIISWLPLGIHRIYALITSDMSKIALRKSVEGQLDEITSMIDRFENSLLFYVYLLVDGTLYRQTFLRWITQRAGQ